MRKSPFLHTLVLIAFLANTFGLICPITCSAEVEEFRLPAPGVMVGLSPDFSPPILKGIKVHPDNPFQFDFILDQGDEYSRHPERRSSCRTFASCSEGSQQEQLKTEANKLIKYFLASLTIPEKDLWVNLSPYEKDRIIPQSFGQTEMGRDLLAEDYMLKQITASLIYPEGETGKKFWKRIYEEAYKRFGTTNIPVNTFNKVWIVPEKAVVYENAKAGTAYVVESKLKVMLEQDYLALSHNVIPAKEVIQDTSALGSQIVRQIVIPELTKEVNEDKNFAQLRQVYNSLILATWYKKKIKDSILEQVYADKNKTAGVQYNRSVILSAAKDLNKLKDSSDMPQNDTDLIYQRYLQAFKKGVFNYIKDTDTSDGVSAPRKYFSGGVSLFNLAMTTNPVIQYTGKAPQALNNAVDVTVNMALSNDRGQQAVENRAMAASAYAEVLNQLKAACELPSPSADQKEKIRKLGLSLRGFRDPDMGALVNAIKTSSGEQLVIFEHLLSWMGPKVIDMVLIPLIEKDTPRDVLDMVERVLENYDEHYQVDNIYTFFDKNDKSVKKDMTMPLQTAFEKLLLLDRAMTALVQKLDSFRDEIKETPGSNYIGFVRRMINDPDFRPYVPANESSRYKSVANDPSPEFRVYDEESALRVVNSIRSEIFGSQKERSENRKEIALWYALELTKSAQMAKQRDEGLYIFLDRLAHKVKDDPNWIASERSKWKAIYDTAKELGVDEYPNILNRYKMIARRAIIDQAMFSEKSMDQWAQKLGEQAIGDGVKWEWLHTNYNAWVNANPEVYVSLQRDEEFSHHQEIINTLFLSLEKSIGSQRKSWSKRQNNTYWEVFKKTMDYIEQKEIATAVYLKIKKDKLLMGKIKDFDEFKMLYGKRDDNESNLHVALIQFYVDGIVQNHPTSWGKGKNPRNTRDFRLKVFDMVSEMLVKDKAQAAAPTGGIDLTSAQMNLKTQNNGGEIKFHLDPAMLAQLQNAPGFMPVIVSVKPLRDLQGFLGIVNQT